MSNSTNVCPYYRGVSAAIIHCTGVERCINADLTFPQGADRAAYCERFCLGKYSECDILGALDEACRSMIVFIQSARKESNGITQV